MRSVDDDHEPAHDASSFEVPDRIRHLGQRERPVDDQTAEIYERSRRTG